MSTRTTGALLVVASMLGHVGLGPALAKAPGGLDAMQAMLSRVSVRQFDQTRGVTDGELKQIVDAGYRAQTLDGSRPFEFVTIRDRKTLQAIGQAGKFADWMGRAPAAIAVVVRTKDSPRLYQENGSLAIMDMTYKAQQLGLGTCFLGTRNNRKLKQILGIPGRGHHLVTVLPVGAPARGFGALKSPKRYPVEWTVSQGSYGGGLPRGLLGATPSPRVGTGMAAFLSGKHERVEEFSQREVESAKLATALEAMRHAPSSKNKQHWRWVLVTDPKGKARVARAARDRKLARAPVVAVLAGSQDSRPFINPRGWGRRRTSPTFIKHGATMALRNLQIGLQSQGLGVRTTALSTRGDQQLRVALSPGKNLSAKRVQFIAAMGIGYASQRSVRQVRGIPRTRVFRERHGRR